MQFSEFPLPDNLLKSIEAAGYIECTDVQAQTLKHTLEGKDVFVQSKTGTGKTAAFLISILALKAKSPGREQALIIVPTRELAVQIEEEARLLSTFQEFTVATAVGGMGYHKQEQALAEGVDFLVGTPGRLLDLIQKRTLNLKNFTYAVIDEADRMFDMGFVTDIRRILKGMPGKNIRQTMLFSATLSYEVKRLAIEFMNDPVEVLVSADSITVEAIDQQLYHVGSARKMELVLGILKRHPGARTLIFANMKHRTEEVAGRLCHNGLEADFLTGDLPQNHRQRRIDRFKNKELPILVATDVAARGLHIDDLDLVINFDVPQFCEQYVHRIGRTARAGKSGKAFTLACEYDAEFLAPIEKFIKMEIPAIVAEEEDFAEDLSRNRSFKTGAAKFRRKSENDSGGRDRGGRDRGGRDRGGRDRGGRDRGGRSQDSRPPRERSVKQGGPWQDKSPPREQEAAAPRPADIERKRSRRPDRPERADRPDSQKHNRKHDQTVKKAPDTKKKGVLSRVFSIFRS